MPHVFISYKRDDRAFATELENRIIESELETWSDNQLRAGEQWREKIDDAIRASFALVVVMTPEARSSEYVTYEWAFALGLGVPVIPIMLEKTDLHPKLSEFHFLDFTIRYDEPWINLIQRLKEIEAGYQPTTIRIEPKTPAAMKRAIAALDSPSENDRLQAVTSLSNMSHPDALITLKTVKESHIFRDVRSLAAFYLALAGDASVVAELESLLFPEEQYSVLHYIGGYKDLILALKKIGTSQSIDVLIKIVTTNHNAMNDAIAGLGEIQSLLAIPVLIDALGVREGVTKYRAEYALLKYRDPKAIAVIVSSLNEARRPYHQQSIIDVLHKIDTPEAKAAIERLQNL